MAPVSTIEPPGTTTVAPALAPLRRPSDVPTAPMLTCQTAAGGVALPHTPVVVPASDAWIDAVG